LGKGFQNLWLSSFRAHSVGFLLVLHAIEARLSEVLRAGERLGISPEEVLQDLRYRNQVRK
uniref:GntR family transcriptional regulator n=1 Tax=Heligmosomoides polygyrus TaxID=6339 RepID=A0A183G0S1_HELPZ